MSELKSVDKARGLLKKLFRTENADLDFGIYRIMNFKRAEVERFIDEDLIRVVEEEFKEFAKTSSVELEKELERRKKEINEFVPGTISDDWVVSKNRDLPKVQEFLGVLEEYKAASVSEEQVQDVFNHVYEFFSRYYEDGDFIPRTRYGGRDKYYVPYNGEEVLLHWATKDMYYVKTGEYFNKFSFRAGRFRVTFRLVDAQIEQGNVKGDNKFFILHGEDPVYFDDASGDVEIRFNYRALTGEEIERYSTRKTQEDLIDKALDNIQDAFGVSSLSGKLIQRSGEEKSLLRKHIEAYVQRNTKDFFINKDLKGFLSKELDFYLKNEFWNPTTLENALDGYTRLAMAKAKAIQGISNKIIEFLTQIEEYEKKLFEKAKFVLRTDYGLTLDHIPEKFYDEIGSNEEQIKEWKEIYALDEITQGTLFNTRSKNKLSLEFLTKYKYMMVDTKYFSSDFKFELLMNINELENSIDGLLIKGDNYNVLKLMLPKYENYIDCIYIDPPYNTGEDGFIYKDKYMSSSWNTMMYDRILLGKEILKKDGIFLSSIDDNEIINFTSILDNIYGKENRLGILVWNLGTGTQAGHFTRSHEYILTYAKEKTYLSFFKSTDDSPIIHGALKRISRVNPASEIKFPEGIEYEGTNAIFEGDLGGSEKQIIVNGKMIFENGKLKKPVTLKAGWAMKKQILSWLKGEATYDSKGQKVKKFFFNRQGILWYEKERTTYHPKTVLNNIANTKEGSTELDNLFNKRLYNFPKPTSLLKYLFETVTDLHDTIIDYYAGSGSTADAILKLNRIIGKRKYILIDAENYFENIMIKRIKKCVFSKEWKNGIPLDRDGLSQIIKYQYIENFEDVLNNIEAKRVDGYVQKKLDLLSDYFLVYMLDYETKDSPTRINFDQFKTPFNYIIKTIKGGEEKEEPVDLLETFNYLLGLWVDRLRTFKDGERLYRVIYGKRGNEQTVVIWRDMPDLDLKRDKEFIEKTILLDNTPDTIYINGDSYLENANPIEPEFKRLMGA